MATVNSVDNIAAMLAISSPSLNDTVEVLGYDTPNDGGGGTFYWDTASDTDNGGTIFVPGGGTGACWRRIYDGFIDVKWFGCKGDNVTDDRANFQNALDFVGAQIPHKVDLYISQGRYRIGAPPSGTECLYLDLYTKEMVNVYGDGALVSILRYDSAVNNTVFQIRGFVNSVTEISDFTIYNESSTGKGLVLKHMQFTSLNNMVLTNLHTALELIDVLSSSARNLLLSWSKYGLNTDNTVEPGDDMAPNTLNFMSCNFHSNTILGAKLTGNYGFHTNIFTSCSFEGNGTFENSATGGLHGAFRGPNGATGLNMDSCYFEANAGGFDVKLDCLASGAHSFTNNTFNRLQDNHFTEYNILIDGSGQSPQPVFGFSKTKLIFQGNGFFVGSGYTPSPSQRAIELLNSSPDYWQYDIVEQGNVYMGVVDAPDFNKKTPQISEFTRVKAFGIVEERTSVWTVINGYNVASCTRVSAGLFRVDLANDLGRNVIVNITPHNTTGIVIANVTVQSTNLFVVSFNDLAGGFLDTFFNFTVF